MKGRILFFSFILLGCSSASKMHQVKNIPLWVGDVSKECDQIKEICAVGEGKDGELADHEAKKSLELLFQNSMRNYLLITDSTASKSKEEILSSAEFFEIISQGLEQITQKALTTAIIKKRVVAKKENTYYSLITLNRKKAAEEFLAKIKLLDEQLQNNFNQNSRLVFSTLSINYDLRQQLQLRYQFLTGNPFPPVITATQIQQRKTYFLASQPKVWVKIEDLSTNKELEKFMVQSLSRHFLNMVNQDKSPDISIVGKMTAEKSYLRTQTAEKYHFFLKIYSEKNQEKMGMMTLGLFQVGQNLQDAYQQILPQFKEQILQNLEGLNIP